jgi:hypothetical protein
MQDPEYELDFVTVLKELDEHVFNGFVELFVNSGQSNPMRFTISGATDITVRFALGDVTERKVYSILYTLHSTLYTLHSLWISDSDMHQVFDRVGVAVVGIRDKLIHDVALESIAISFSPYLISFYVVLTLYNPLSTDFTLSNVSYSVYFDDMDGVPIPFFYPPKEHIKLTEVKDDVPKYLPGALYLLSCYLRHMSQRCQQ